MKNRKPIPMGSWGSHSVFGSPAMQVPENPKAEHPTPKNASTVLAYLLTHLAMKTPARRRLPPKSPQSSQPKDTHFVSGVKKLQRALNLGLATRFGIVP